jgi:hypothetical protein
VAGVTAWEPVAASLPLHAPLAAQETACVLDHISVADWPAVIEVGLTDRVTAGIGAGGAVDLLPPQACSARAMRAAAAAGQGFRIRKLVRNGDMLPRPLVCYGAGRPNTIQRGSVPTNMESCGGTLVPSVNSHTTRLAPSEFYSVARTNKQFQRISRLWSQVQRKSLHPDHFQISNLPATVPRSRSQRLAPDFVNQVRLEYSGQTLLDSIVWHPQAWKIGFPVIR